MALPVIPIVTGLFSLGKTWLDNRQKKSEAKGEKEAELIKQVGSWEELHAKGSQTSWTNEYYSIVFSIPFIMCFIPTMVPYVTAGFEALAATPVWYRNVVITLVGASIGIRQLDKHLVRRKLNKAGA